MSEIGRKHYLYPGTLFVHKSPHVVTTVLGSCVSVCLWDVKNKFGGINHFNLPLWNGDGLATPKFGNIAIQRLIEKMIMYGSDQKNLVSKIFGGGAVINSISDKNNIGEKNIIVTLDLLEQARIPIISSSVGGKKGRKIIFHTENGDVFVKMIKGTFTGFK
ncbi:chemotaxis protein CheD [candidate division KSB1 bacterium]|nr:chemotaxis protein CheD [candidate division KSB1 bacterium]